MGALGAGVGLGLGWWLNQTFSWGFTGFQATVFWYHLIYVVLVVVLYVTCRLSEPAGTWTVDWNNPGAGSEFGRGALVGLTAMVNWKWLSLLSFMPSFVSLPLLVFVVGVALLPLARSRPYQVVVGWSGWLLPMAWPASLIGLVLFIIWGVMAFAQQQFAAFRVDWSSGSLDTAAPISPGPEGVCFGNFIFEFVGNPPTVRSALRRPGVAAHESGHVLANASMGSAVLGLGWLDQTLSSSAEDAYSELLAEGRFPETGRKALHVWSS